MESLTNENSTLVTGGGAAPTLTWSKKLSAAEVLKFREPVNEDATHKLSANKWAYALEYGFGYDPTYMYVNMYQVTRNSSGESGEFIQGANCNQALFPITNFTRASKINLEGQM